MSENQEQAVVAPKATLEKLKAVFPVNAIKVSLDFDATAVMALLEDETVSIEDKLAQLDDIESPMLLVRWPRGIRLPEAISDELKLKGIIGVPTVSIQSPVDGSAVLALMALEARRAEGPVGIEVEFDELHVRLTSSGKYITISPDSVDLDTYHEIKPVFASEKVADDETKLKARLMNRINSLRIQARISASEATPSGSIVPGDDGAPVATGDDPF